MDINIRKPDPIDVHVGAVLRAERVRRGISQSELGERVGVTFQQVQKYERGTNRVSASRLFRIADVLGKPVADFFPEHDTMPDPERRAIISPDGLKMNQAMEGIRDQQVRRSILELTRTISEAAQ